ncbi:MAG: bifunctional phosphopantothenoylcysteine decarboxylase/phosphopantothenate--cysteine ligase CoaBC [Chloroflexi bacterium]|nr:bifunctional phosphopantothenoylcysteine decarboxylase/phosphopantothenate--cysteine ligase CoaBC [Chloroflexota bacterium]MBT3671165.1 bifunctional phosphopantothenoylcysteine decarboxylase/phosphopantothenate--cysteine ligase CoaBC [Chloroflexota bacterium]MBT4002554.1 bifunctional phosphopantothenoylcysteine decarboxylase/phosphopantothenate--cysteine ligase CoaBC [Chloroflexota bacterium]MBT4304376.1 bifunctional phosphopantothenoylcysteine decarboxylase/phosphopantothenate--cysteine liga
MHPIKKKRILLGVTGSIAAYKSADLASKLTQAGAEVDVILTKAATAFVSLLTFQSVTGRKAYVDADLWGDQGHVVHISLGKEADLFVIAPVTANTMAKMVHGEAGNLLTLTALAAECPILIAPAMDGGMYSHPATQANLEILKSRKVTIIGPEAGHLASGMRAVGRMTEPSDLFGNIRYLFSRSGPLTGKKILVTAGGTQEAIDPVRFITNRSSGKQGFAIAQVAIDMGAEVRLISGPNLLPTPIGVERTDVRSAEEMSAAVISHTANADVLIMAAAVADYRPIKNSSEKIKKSSGIPEIKLKATQDILKNVSEEKKKSGKPKVIIGFAAESKDVIENAEKKLLEKGLDFIVANDISAKDAGFEVDTNRVTIISADGSKEALPLLTKEQVAIAILEKVEEILK